MVYNSVNYGSLQQCKPHATNLNYIVYVIVYMKIIGNYEFKLVHLAILRFNYIAVNYHSLQSFLPYMGNLMLLTCVMA